METGIKGTDIYRYIELLETGKKFMKMMNKYRCAIMEVETKLKVLNAEFSLQYDRNPIETIKSRLKSADGIVENMIIIYGCDIFQGIASVFLLRG